MKEKFIVILIALILAIPLSGQNNQTKRVAILETVDKEGRVPYGVKLMVRSKLCEFITAIPGYEGFDRVDVGAILNEHEFQQSGLVSDKDIKRLGEMMGVDYVLVAEAAYLNDSYVFLSAKILNVETAKVEQTASVQSPTTVEGLDQNCKNLAGKLLNVNIETGALRGELMLSEGKYIGEYKNGKLHGRGIIYFYSDDSSGRKSYDGEWVNGVREGSGTMVWNHGGMYVGNWVNNKGHGKATEYYSDGSRYEGDFQSNHRHGFGTYYFKNGDIYEGNWVNNNGHGKATLIYHDGDRLEGYFNNGKVEGIATYYKRDGKHADFYYEKGKRQSQKTDWKY